MRTKGILLTRLLAPMGCLAAAAGVVAPAWPGTELGNARFIDYSNDLHGISFSYPEEWNLIDLGNAVNVVGAVETLNGPSIGGGVLGNGIGPRDPRGPSGMPETLRGRGGFSSRFAPDAVAEGEGSSPEFASFQSVEGLGAVESVEIFFETSQYFATGISFERYVRRVKPTFDWRPTTFRGKFAFHTRTRDREQFVVFKDNRTAMFLSYPLELSSGLPPALVEKTVNTIDFRSP